jgi:GNAT superfamily N-acetyltransferase
MNIKELTADEEIQSSWEIMKELRADLVESEFIEFVKAMRREGYRLFGLFKDNTLVSVVGFAILINLYYKRHVWIYDLVTKESERSRGYGSEMLKFVEAVAKNEGCEIVALSSGLERASAHRFYEDKFEFTKSSFVFKKMI